MELRKELHWEQKSEFRTVGWDLHFNFKFSQVELFFTTLYHFVTFSVILCNKYLKNQWHKDNKHLFLANTLQFSQCDSPLGSGSAGVLGYMCFILEAKLQSPATHGVLLTETAEAQGTIPVRQAHSRHLHTPGPLTLHWPKQDK